MNSHHIVVVILCALYSNFSNAATWAEMGDAGDMPNSAQIISGVGDLTEISGFISSDPFHHVDMFQIYISNHTTFWATSNKSNFLFDGPQLFLFDSDGYGIYASGLTSGSTLTAGSPIGPKYSGIYYLAISPFNIDAQGLNSFGTESLIFTDSTNDLVVGPDGNGGSSPITGWGGTYSGNTTDYTITLNGASFISSVPLPPALWFFISGLLGLIGIARKKRATS